MFPNQGITPKPLDEIIHELPSTELEPHQAEMIFNRLALVQNRKDAYARELAMHVVIHYKKILDEGVYPHLDMESAMKIGERAGIAFRISLLQKVFNVDYKPSLFSHGQSKT